MCKKNKNNNNRKKKVNTLVERSTVWRSGVVFITVASQ